MTKVTSVRNYRKFYLVIFFWVAFCLVMAAFMFGLYSQALSQVGGIALVVMDVGMLSLAGFIVFRYYKNSPIIIVNNEYISFNGETYYWKDLEAIEMTGKRSFKFMGERKEGVLLKFKGQNERYIFDDMYENAPAIKTYIEKTVSDVIPIEPKQAINTGTNESTPEKFTYYKGFPLFSFDGIIWGGFILFLLSIGIFDFSHHHHPSVIIMMVILSFLIFIAMCYRWNYFGISNSTLIIKNYNLFWLIHEYSLTDIREIIFEEAGGRAAMTRMRIIFKDFSTKKYPAATIWSKSWMQLKEDLEKKNIKVRNESVIYEPFEFKLFND